MDDRESCICATWTNPFVICPHKLTVGQFDDEAEAIQAALSGRYKYVHLPYVWPNNMIKAITSAPGIDAVRMASDQDPVAVLSNLAIRHLFIGMLSQTLQLGSLALAGGALRSLSLSGQQRFSGSLNDLQCMPNLQRLGIHDMFLNQRDVEALIILPHLIELDVEYSVFNGTSVHILIMKASVHALLLDDRQIPGGVSLNQLGPDMTFIRRDYNRTLYVSSRYLTEVRVRLAAYLPTVLIGIIIGYIA